MYITLLDFVLQTYLFAHLEVAITKTMIEKFKLASSPTVIPWIQDEMFDNIQLLPEKIIFLASKVCLFLKVST